MDQPTLKQYTEDNNDESSTSQPPPTSDDHTTEHEYREQTNILTRRTDPMIGSGRQRFLKKRLEVTANIEKGDYPFKGKKLSRADVVWLLANQENEKGLVIHSDKNQLDCKGLDLRGANLSGTDLHGLPLANTRFGLTEDQWFTATQHQCDMAAAHLEEANLSEAHLEGAAFCKARLEQANLCSAHLEKADFFEANLKGAYFHKANLEGANLQGANIEEAKISKAELRGAKIDEELMKMVGQGRSIVPPSNITREFSLSDFFSQRLRPTTMTKYEKTFIGTKWFLRPFKRALSSGGLLVGIIIVLVSAYVTQSIDSSTRRSATHQKELEIKTTLVNNISQTIGNSLTELELIERNSEISKPDTAIQQYYNAFRDLQVNGSEIESQLSTYFSRHDQRQAHSTNCDNLFDNLNLAWNNYYNAVIYNMYLIIIFDKSIKNDEIKKEITSTIYYIKWVFDYCKISENFQADLGQQPIETRTIDWNSLENDYTTHPFGSNTILVQMNGNWDYWESFTASFRYPIEHCILDTDISDKFQ